MRSYLDLLGRPHFLGLYIGQVISRLGDGIATIVIVWSVWEITHSPLIVALAFTAQTLALILFSFFGGIIADRFVHKQIMILTDLVRMGIALSAAGIIRAGMLHYWVLILIGFLFNSAACFFQPARAAFQPRILPQNLLQPANGLISGSFHGAVLIGSVIGGWLLNHFDIATLLLFDAVTFGISILGLLLLPSTRSSRNDQPGQISKEIKEGWKTVRQVPVLSWIMGTMWIGILFSGGVGEVGRTLLMDQLKAGATGLGLITTTMGLGLMIGSFGIGLIQIRYKLRLFMTAWIMEGILSVLMGISPNLPFALTVSFLAGIATACINVPSDSLIQWHGKNHIGKISSFMTITIWLGQLGSLTLIAPMFDVLPLFVVYSLSGIALTVLASLGLVLSWSVEDQKKQSAPTANNF